MNNRKTPRIRFKGFTDDWEQRKLGKVFEEYSEKNHEDLPTLILNCKLRFHTQDLRQS